MILFRICRVWIANESDLVLKLKPLPWIQVI